jgi:acetyl-CoA carboxylase biotin carboxyl carrier protein
MTLSAKDVAEILRLLDSSTFDSLSLEMNGVKLNLQRGSAMLAGVPAAAAQPVESEPQALELEPTKGKPTSQPGLAEIASPLLGIFYRAPKPGEPPFVEVGSKVNEETVVGII